MIKNKVVVFKTNHFSDFVIDYNLVSFDDIKTHWARRDIEYLANRNIINGMSKSEFYPNGSITRAQFVTLLKGLSGIRSKDYKTSQFGDVKEGSWYLDAVEWAVENNISNGYKSSFGDFVFGPENTITRQDMAVMIIRYLENIDQFELKEKQTKIDFADESKISSYAKDAVLKLQQAGMINGKGIKDGRIIFEPLGNLTRAEAAKIIASIIKSYN